MSGDVDDEESERPEVAIAFRMSDIDTPSSWLR